MSQISRAILGAIAVSLTVGAVQFASGHDLTGGLGTTIGTTIGTTLGANLGTSLGTGLKAGFGTTVAAATPSGINRAAKADRAAAAVARSGGPTRTVSIRLDSLAETSVVIRIPATEELHSAPPSPTPVLTKPADRKLTACEPVVSILTEVAKLLRPGRCMA